MKDEELLTAFEEVERFITYRNRKSHGNLFLLLGTYFSLTILFSGYKDTLKNLIPVPLSMVSGVMLICFGLGFVFFVGTGFHSAYKIHIGRLEEKKKSIFRKREIFSYSAVLLILMCVSIMMYLLIRAFNINFCMIFLLGVAVINFAIFSVITRIYEEPQYHTELFWIGVGLFISGALVMQIPPPFSLPFTAGTILILYSGAAYRVYKDANDMIKEGVIEEFAKIFSSKSKLSNPIRLGIMILLKDKNGMIFTEIQNALHLTSGNLDSHLKHLENDECVRIKKVLSKEGPRTAVYMTKNGEDELKRYLSKLRVGLSVRRS
jgi:DNA-binding HxlR family transcriptional regulator